MTEFSEARWSRAVITGADGFIGVHLVRELQQTGKEVIAFGRSRSRGAISGGDLCEPGALDNYLGDETFVFHLAGTADIRRSVDAPLEDFRRNMAGSLNVLESVRKAGAGMLFASTASVYDRNGMLPFAETGALRPSSPYAAAKAGIEAYCAAYARSYQLDIRVARLFSVYGPGMRRFAVYDFYRRIGQNPTRLTIRGDGNQTRDYLFVKDASRMLVQLASLPEAAGVYNVASGVPRKMQDVARAVAIAMGLSDCRIVPDNVRYEAELDRLEADVTKIGNAGLLKNLISFEEGLASTIAWFEQQKMHALTD